MKCLGVCGSLCIVMCTLYSARDPFSSSTRAHSTAQKKSLLLHEASARVPLARVPVCTATFNNKEVRWYQNDTADVLHSQILAVEQKKAPQLVKAEGLGG